MTTALDDFFVTTETLAEYLGEKVSVLHSWRHRGVGPPSSKSVGRIRYRWSEVQAWLAVRDAETKRGDGVTPQTPAVGPSPSARVGPLDSRDGSAVGPRDGAA